ncbi:MAG: hypothetical protein L3J28_11170 [Candidatus Polarisedimenticolaceae bacterium]|nr:hypothetical protein [Candidatus Polarisedimenticolaceae bacterium]
MKPLTLLPLAVISALAISSPISAEVLLLNKIAEAPANRAIEKGLTRPTKGMSMEQVVTRFGEPWGSLPPVGTPPITRWHYPGYTVVFEYQYVITSVVED